MNKDVVFNKSQTIYRCIKRIDEEYAGNPDNLSDYTRQDAIILNIMRACEACIDLAMHIVSEKRLGIPQNSRDAFEFLQADGLIDKDLETSLKAMVGFRNIAVHDYQALNLNIVREIIEKHLKDFLRFVNVVLKLS